MTAHNAASQTPRSRRRWLRYSLRTLLLATAAVAVWLAVQVNRATNQRRAVTAVKDRGGTVYYLHQGYVHPVRLTDFSSPSTFDPDAQPPGPDWLRRFLGDEYFQDVIYVRLGNRDASETNNYVKSIAALPKLEYIDTGSRDLTEEELRQLGGVRTLRVLRFFSNEVTDDGLQYLRGSKTLEILDIGSTAIRGPGLRHLVA